MIKEIALDPMAAPEPNEMHTLLKLAFGAHCGRYLSDFPSNDWWQEYEKRFAATQPHRLTELRRSWVKMSHDFKRTFLTTDDWCQNAYREHTLRPFAIVGTKVQNSFGFPSPDDDTFVEALRGGNVGGPFGSSPDEYVNICRVLIARGPLVVLNDPYLSKLHEYDREQILLALLAATVGSRTTDFLIFTQLQKEGLSADEVRRKFDAVIKTCRRTCRVKLFLVKQTREMGTPDFHRRFLATRDGGWVFDEGFERNPWKENKANLMPAPEHSGTVGSFIDNRPKWPRNTVINKYDPQWQMPK